MSKFNQKTEMKTINRNGNVAYKMGDELKLITQVLTSFFNEKKFYGDNSNEIIELARTVCSNKPRFIANLSLYARKVFNMRSISHVLVAILANDIKGKKYVRDLINKVVLRADDLTEIVAYYISMYGKPIPNSIKKGVADKLNDFTEYEFAKYKGKGKSVSMKDLIMLSHPKAKDDEQNNLFKKVLDGKLETPYTWEVELSTKGNTKEVWEKLIDSEKVGYMALLRNLRNILNANPNNIEKVYETISNKERVVKSKQLPFRFMTAYKMLSQEPFSRKGLEAIEKALDHSVANIKPIKGRTVIAVDTSGSMGWNISNNSIVTCSDIALTLGAIANQICEDAVIMTFDNHLNVVNLSTSNSVLSNVNSIHVNGGGTNMSLPFEKMIEDKIFADRVIVLSDNEVNYGTKTIQVLANNYRKEVNENLWVHAIDLQGYGTQQFIGGKTNIIAGWSEKVLEFIDLAENGFETLLKRIANYEFKG